MEEKGFDLGFGAGRACPTPHPPDRMILCKTML